MPEPRRVKSAKPKREAPALDALPKAPGRGKYDRSLSPEARAKEQRARLFRATSLVFATRGFGASTVDDVCAAAGISRRTFYETFRDLDHALSELHDRLSRRSFTAVERYVKSHEDPDLQLRAGVEGLLAMIANFPNESKVMFVVSRAAGRELDAKREALLQRFATLMHDGIARSYALGHCAVPPDELRIYALVSAIEAVGIRYVQRGEHERALEATEPLVDLVARAFATKSSQRA